MLSPYDVACPVCELPAGANCRDRLGRVRVDPHPERDQAAADEQRHREQQQGTG